MVHEVLYTICTNIYTIHGTRELCQIMEDILFHIHVYFRYKNALFGKNVISSIRRLHRGVN